MQTTDTALRPDVPGYVLDTLLGAGAHAVVWRATAADEPGRPAVAVKIVRPGPDADRELAVLRAVAHPHVLGLHDAVALDDGRLALVTDLLDGGTLADVVAARGRLRPGEVVTVLVPLARALAALHAQGVQHGDLAPGNVLFDRDGRPALADLGTTRLTGEPRLEVYGTPGYVDPAVLTGTAPGPPSDVYGLAALGWLALTGSPPPSPPCRRPLAELVAGVPEALVAAVEAAVDPRPARRPAPLELARALHAAAPAQPVWRPGRAPAEGGLTHRVRVLPDPPARPARHRRERRPRRRALIALAAVLCAGGVAGVVLGANALAGRERSRSGPPHALADDRAAAAVVARLAALRAVALGDPEHARPTGAAPGSRAERADQQAVDALRAEGLRYSRLRLTPRQVHLVSSAGGRAVAHVVLDASAYDVVAAGHVVRHVAAARGTRATLDLTVVPGQGWRVVAVRPW